MDETNVNQTEESTAVEPEQENQSQQDDLQSQQADCAQCDAPAKKKVKLPGIVDKINANENLRQMVVFTLFSFICGGSQLILTLVLTQLKYAGGLLAEPFRGIPVGNFAIFGYETTAEFIGFLVGSVTGQVPPSC